MRRCDSQIKVCLINRTHLLWKLHPPNPLNSSTTAVVTISVSDNGRAVSTITEVFSVLCFLTFTLSYYSSPLSHPLILPLCLCEEACSPAGSVYRDASLKSPRGERFLNPSCPPGLMQCISLLLGFFVRHSRRSITSDPSNDNLWASCPP